MAPTLFTQKLFNHHKENSGNMVETNLCFISGFPAAIGITASTSMTKTKNSQYLHFANVVPAPSSGHDMTRLYELELRVCSRPPSNTHYNFPMLILKGIVPVEYVQKVCLPLGNHVQSPGHVLNVRRCHTFRSRRTRQPKAFACTGTLKLQANLALRCVVVVECWEARLRTIEPETC